MDYSPFMTIPVGVAVFVISQYFLKLVLEPIASVRKVRSNIVSTILFHRAQITNARADNLISEELRKLSATLRSSVSEIICYNQTSIFFDLPCSKRVFEACRELNGLAHGMNSVSQEASPNTDWPMENTKAIRKVADLLKTDIHFLWRSVFAQIFRAVTTELAAQFGDFSVNANRNLTCHAATNYAFRS